METVLVAETSSVPLTVRLVATATFPMPRVVSVPPVWTVIVDPTVSVRALTRRLPPFWMTIEAASPLPDPVLTDGLLGTAPGIVRVSRAVGVPLGVQLSPLLKLMPTAPVQVRATATRYGPTTGPPPGAPTGVTPTVDVSVLARP